MKTIHFFGDSWTRGDGCQFEPGSGIIQPHIKYGPNYSKEYDTFSFPAQIRTLLNDNVNILNTGWSGASNFDVYKSILHTLRENKFKKNDIAIISWTSILREPVNYMVTPGDNQQHSVNVSGIENSLKGHLSVNTWIPVSINQMTNPIHKTLFKKIHEDFIVDRLNLNSLYENCMNYICNLQILFEELGVNYIFINTFERAITSEVSFYNKIKQDKWIRFDSTLSDYLCDIEDTMSFENGYSLWEDDHIKPGRNLDGPHPNRIGYRYIAELLHMELLKRNFI